jgi:aminocarboxymuconate-semialdehyde decarboxylase
MRIDVHAHYWTEDYLDVLVELGKTDTGTQRGLRAGSGRALAARLRLMDRAGVEMQVLSAAPQLPYAEDRRRALTAAHFVNDQYSDLVERRPDRFRAFAALPLPHIEEAIEEIRRTLDDLDMAGVTMNTTALGRAMVEPEFEPVFADLDRRAAVLFLHPAGRPRPRPRATRGDRLLRRRPTPTRHRLPLRER